MAKLNYDAEADEGRDEFELVREGEHSATVVKTRTYKKEETGNLVFEICFQVGRLQVMTWVPLSVGWRVNQLINAFGGKGKISETSDIEDGSVCGIVVKHGQWNGKPSASVEKLYAIKGDDDDDLF